MTLPSNSNEAAIHARLAGATGGMVWTGPVFPGGPQVELVGDAKSIYEQILAMNPDYAPHDSAAALGLLDGNNQTLARGVDHGLHERDDPVYSCSGLEPAISSIINVCSTPDLAILYR